jgi:hypothetical protein
MAWTYSGNPSSSALDEIRYLIGDTIQTKPWTLQDAEIQYAIDLYSAHPPVIGQNYRAAAEAAQNILTKLMGAINDKKVGDLSISVNNSALTFFRGAYNRLRALATLHAVPPYLGGYSHSEKQAQDANPDRVQLAIKIEGMDLVSGETENKDERF